MKSWEMWVYCRRGGLTRDAGLHKTFRQKPEPIEIETELQFLRRFYDEISYSLKEVESA